MDNLPEAWEKYVEKAERAHWAYNSSDTLNWMRAAILAFLDAAEKDGWVMVPEYPSIAMEKAWIDHFGGFGDKYTAMLDAAKEEGKTPDSPPSTPVV